MLREWLERLGWGRKDDTAAGLSETLRSAVTALTTRFAQEKIDHALIGGVALAAHGLVRATLDLDLLVDAARDMDARRILAQLGFETLHVGENFSNHLLDRLRVDILYARRPHRQRMLERAIALRVGGVLTKVVQREDLVGLKLQALASDPTRSQDRSDIETLVRDFAGVMDMDRVREYYTIFEREAELDALLEAVRRGN